LPFMWIIASYSKKRWTTKFNDRIKLEIASLYLREAAQNTRRAFMKLFKHITLSILLSSFSAILVSIISNQLFEINEYELVFFIGCPLLAGLIFCYSKICQYYPGLGLIDYLLVGIITVLPTSFLSCYLLYQCEGNGRLSHLYLNFRGDFLFVTTAIFVMVSACGLIASVFVSSFIIIKRK
jgi:hypothetical protein